LGNAFGFLDIFIFPLPFQWTLDIFPPVVRYRPEYIFAAEGRGAAGQKRCPLTFQWTFFWEILVTEENIFLLRKREEQRRRKP